MSLLKHHYIYPEWTLSLFRSQHLELALVDVPPGKSILELQVEILMRFCSLEQVRVNYFRLTREDYLREMCFPG